MAEDKPKRKYDSKLMQYGNIVRVNIPPEILAETGLVDQDPLEVFVNEKGNIELRPKKADTGATTCMVCEKLTARYKCINCGRMACSNCFWEMGGLCRKCAKMK